jgi:tRNA(His) 5'-end guanylyltransferase
MEAIKKFFGFVPLKKRMLNLLQKANSDKFDSVGYRIITVKSKHLLKYLNENFETRHSQIQTILTKVAKESYHQFGPVMIFVFNNEFNYVFDSNTELYNGNINRTITALASYLTNRVTKELFNMGVNLEFFFTSKFVEFGDTTYETFNYLVWRQCECYRNNVLALAKLENLPIDNMKTKTLFESLRGEYPDYLFNGTIIKKEIVYMETTELTEKVPQEETKLFLRTTFTEEHPILSDSFSSNCKKYLYNRYL